MQPSSLESDANPDLLPTDLSRAVTARSAGPSSAFGRTAVQCPPRSRSPFVAVVAVSLLVALVGCAITGDQTKLLEQSLEAHASIVRWGDPIAGLELADPALRESLVPSGLERERWRQFQVAGYRAQPPRMLGPDRAVRIVELELVNRNTQVARTVTWRQEWRFDAAAKRWWLMSGLPSLDGGAR